MGTYSVTFLFSSPAILASQSAESGQGPSQTPRPTGEAGFREGGSLPCGGEPFFLWVWTQDVGDVDGEARRGGAVRGQGGRAMADF